MSANSLNRTTLSGTVVGETRLDTTAKGKLMFRFTLMTWTMKTRRQFHQISAFDRTAKAAAKCIQTGQQLYVECTLEYGFLTDKLGRKHRIPNLLLKEFIESPPPAADDKATAELPTDPLGEDAQDQQMGLVGDIADD